VLGSQSEQPNVSKSRHAQMRMKQKLLAAVLEIKAQLRAMDEPDSAQASLSGVLAGPDKNSASLYDGCSLFPAVVEAAFPSR
jgi:hypothetical protein